MFFRNGRKPRLELFVLIDARPPASASRSFSNTQRVSIAVFCLLLTQWASVG
jgi:hypothetical protein